MISLPDNREERIKFYADNWKLIETAKKSSIQKFMYPKGGNFVVPPAEIIKNGDLEKDEIIVKAIVSTANVMDSHFDVHAIGSANKTLKENKRVLHIVNHDMYNENALLAKNEDVKGSTLQTTFKELGFKNIDGNTEAVIFESKIRKYMNEKVFEMYKNNQIDQHSVGMQYIKIFLAADDESLGNPYKLYKEMLPQIANSDDAEKAGAFSVVKEYKIFEFSALTNLAGSNVYTNTMQVQVSGKQIQELKAQILELRTEIKQLKPFISTLSEPQNDDTYKKLLLEIKQI